MYNTNTLVTFIQIQDAFDTLSCSSIPHSFRSDTRPSDLLMHFISRHCDIKMQSITHTYTHKHTQQHSKSHLIGNGVENVLLIHLLPLFLPPSLFLSLSLSFSLPLHYSPSALPLSLSLDR